MKIGIVVTLHDFIEAFGRPCIDSVIKHTTYPYHLFVYDNESTDPDRHQLQEDIESRDDVTWIRVDDQKAFGGLTGTWEDGIIRADAKSCDRLVFLNHDTVVYDCWHLFIGAIDEDRVFYGPTSNNVGNTCIHKHQLRGERGGPGGIIDAYCVNGFCWGFTMGTAKIIREARGTVFNLKFPFAKNEDEVQSLFVYNMKDGEWPKTWEKNEGWNVRVVTGTWVRHWKNKAWKKAGPLYSQDFRKENA